MQEHLHTQATTPNLLQAVNDTEQLELARLILAERDAFWFSWFLWDNGYSLQCGDYLLELEEGDTAQGEPPWLYAMGDSDLHSRELGSDVPKPLPESCGCMDSFIEFGEAETSAWGLYRDHFIDADGCRYAVVDNGRRVDDLPAAIIRYDRESGVRHVSLDFTCPNCGSHDLLVRRKVVETCLAQYVKRRDGEYSFSVGPLCSTMPGEALGWSCMKCGREFPSLSSAMEREWHDRMDEHAARYCEAAQITNNKTHSP